VAGLVGISDSYLSKLLNGHRSRPSRDLLLALGYVWGIRDLDEIDQILEAANHPKLTRPAQ
jgi:transcriptional regulator with XRE-family HTH domain